MMKVKAYCVFFVLWIAVCFSLEGLTPHLEKPQQTPALPARYRLVDLGEINTTADFLTKFNKVYSFSPVINNDGYVIANTEKGGILLRPNSLVYSPILKDGRYEFHDINNHGDILVAINRGKGLFEWNICSGVATRSECSYEIYPKELDSHLLFLNRLNDKRWVIGETHPDGKTRPLLWTPEGGLNNLGYYKGSRNFYAFMRDMNDKGRVLGQMNEGIEKPPFTWDEECGLVVLERYRDTIKPQPDGRIEFSDLVLADDGVVYGNYWINENFIDHVDPKAVFYGFRWVPGERALTKQELDNMRIADIGKDHLLVGAVNHRASIRDCGDRPLLLSDLITVNDLKDWELIEATSINDKGQIVGFGTYQGKMHLFRADPLP